MQMSRHLKIRIYTLGFKRNTADRYQRNYPQQNRCYAQGRTQPVKLRGCDFSHIW